MKIIIIIIKTVVNFCNPRYQVEMVLHGNIRNVTEFAIPNTRMSCLLLVGKLPECAR